MHLFPWHILSWWFVSEKLFVSVTGDRMYWVSFQCWKFKSLSRREVWGGASSNVYLKLNVFQFLDLLSLKTNNLTHVYNLPVLVLNSLPFWLSEPLIPWVWKTLIEHIELLEDYVRFFSSGSFCFQNDGSAYGGIFYMKSVTVKYIMWFISFNPLFICD